MASKGVRSDFSELDTSVVTAAKRLLGCILERKLDGQLVRVRIVETEAYDQTDAASHSYKGRTERTGIMFGSAGHLYVYFTYGMYYCCNVVVGPEGYGAAVLIRAVEPLAGEDVMKQRRKSKSGFELTNGPAKLCQALAIDKGLNGHNLRNAPLRLVLRQNDDIDVVTTTRVGITQAKDEPWRFYIKDNPFVSRPAS